MNTSTRASTGLNACEKRKVPRTQPGNGRQIVENGLEWVDGGVRGCNLELLI